MLRFAIQLDILLLLVISIYFLISCFRKNKNLCNIRLLVIVYLVFNIFSFIICNIDLVDLGWNLILLYPCILLTFIIQIITLIIISVKLKKAGAKIFISFDNILSISLLFIPLIVFSIPYIKDLYIINNCEYLIKFNYQNGFIVSDDTYIALINKRPVEVTLIKNLFKRSGKSVEEVTYDVIYNGDDIKLLTGDYFNKVEVNNEDIRKVAIEAKKKAKSAKSADIIYLEDGKYSIVQLMSEEGHGTGLGNYFYSEDKYVSDFKIYGDLDSIIYYK